MSRKGYAGCPACLKAMDEALKTVNTVGEGADVVRAIRAACPSCSLRRELPDTRQTASNGFSTVSPHHSPVGPFGSASNTDQKGALAAPLIDWLTVSFPASALKRHGDQALHRFIQSLFDFSTDVVLTQMQEKAWNWCPWSAQLVDADSNSCGKVGERLDGSFLISLSGYGCQFVSDWHHVAETIAALGGHISRVDIAVDDLQGQCFNVHGFRKAWQDGLFTSNGRPPDARFIDDCGTGKGCTLYIGKKGHKELCIYEKGIQLGDSDSKHVRCELRLFANKLEISPDVLHNPAPYFAAAYPILADFIEGEITRLEVKQRCVDATAKGMVKFLRTQGGASIKLLFDALGDDTAEFIVSQICRNGRPGRFKGYSGDLQNLVRQSLLQGN